MFGAVIHTPDEEHASSGTSDFERIFGFLIPRFHNHRWLIDGGGYEAFSWPPKWYGDEKVLANLDEQMEETARGLLVETPFLMNYMKFLTDFWVDIYGLPESVCGLGPWRQFTSNSYATEVLAQSDIFFENVDGSFWVFACDRNDVVAEVVRRWPGKSELLSVP